MTRSNTRKAFPLHKGAVIYAMAVFSFVFSFVNCKLGHDHRGNGFYLLGFVLLLMGTTVYWIRPAKSPGLSMQYAAVFSVPTLLWDAAVFRLGIRNTLHSSLDVPEIFLISLILNAVCAFWVFASLRKCSWSVQKILTFLRENGGLLVILLFFWILNLETFSWWFKADSNTYYANIVANAKKWDLSLWTVDSFSLGGHNCYGYSIFAYIGQYLLPKNGVGIRIINYTLFSITICVFYKLIGKLLSGISRMNQLLVTAIFAFAPLTFGIMYEITLDFSCLCFFVWFVYSHCTEKKLLTFAAAILLCFSKEPGVLFLGFYALGCIIYRLCTCGRKFSLLNIFRVIQGYEWSILLAPVLFLISWKLASSGWATVTGSTLQVPNSDRSLTFRWDYVFIKLKEMFAMNFAWVLIPIALLAIVLFVFKKRRPSFTMSETVCGLIGFYIAFLAFNFLYFTFPHYRYMQLHIVIYLLLLMLFVDFAFVREKIKNLVLLCVLLLFTVESYITIDPVTFAGFKNVNTGNGKMISTAAYTIAEPGTIILCSEKEGGDLSSHLFGDSVLYNRQQAGFEKIFESAMKQIGYSEDMLIVFPDFFNDNLAYTKMMLLGIMQEAAEPIYYWDAQSGDMTDDKHDIKIHWSSPLQLTPNEFNRYDEVWFVNLDYKEGFSYEDFMDAFVIGSRFTVTKGIWKLEMVQLKSCK